MTPDLLLLIFERFALVAQYVEEPLISATQKPLVTANIATDGY